MPAAAWICTPRPWNCTPDPDTVRPALADSMNLWGDFYRAEELYRNHIAVTSDDPDTRFKLARLLMSAQRFEESRR